MKLKPEEVHAVNAMRSIKGAGQVTVIKGQDGRISVETKQNLQKIHPVERSQAGHAKVHRLRG